MSLPFGAAPHTACHVPPSLALRQFEAKTLFKQHARPVLKDAEPSDSERLSTEDTDAESLMGVSMPAFEAIMAQKYRFQVRALHNVDGSRHVVEVALTAFAGAGC